MNPRRKQAWEMRENRLASRSIAPAALVLFAALAIAQPARADTSLAGRTFVIDPGHGTKLPDGESLNVGAVGVGGLEEADVVLAVGERLAAMLREDGAKVVLTRSYAHPFRTGTVVRIDNRARAELANRLHATAFVALHCDANDSGEATGTSVFWLKPNSAALANVIRKHLRPLGLGESEFRQRDLAVTSQATVPAVLVELGFVTNTGEAALLSTKSFQQKEAVALDGALRELFSKEVAQSHRVRPIQAPVRHRGRVKA